MEKWNGTDRGKLKYWEKNIIQRGCRVHCVVIQLVIYCGTVHYTAGDILLYIALYSW
jgi:hypothetical protein